MRLTVSLLIGALVLGAIGQGTFAQQQAPPAQAASADQLALFRRFATLASDDARRAFLEATPAIRMPEFVTAYVGWLRSAQVPVAMRLPGWTNLEWLGQQTGQDRTIALALAGRGSVYGGQSRFDLARAELERALPLLGPTGDDNVRLNILTSLATALGRLGDSDRALQLFDQAAELALKNRDDAGLARVFNNKGSFYFTRGDLRRAHDAYRRSLDLSVDDGAAGTAARIRTMGNIGSLYLELGDYAQAIRYYEEAVAAALKGPPSNSLATLMANLGFAYRPTDPEKAKMYLDKAMAEAERIADGGVAANIFHNRGLLAYDQENWAAARAAFEQSLELHEMGGERRGMSESLAELADVAIRQDDMAGAEQYLIRARDIALKAGVPPALIRAQVGLGAVAELRGQSAQALALYKEAEEILETLSQQTIGSERTQQNFLSYRLAPYLGTAAVHAKERRFEDALMATERARARVLLGILDGGQPVAQMSEAERVRERGLIEQLAAANMQLADEQRKAAPDPARLTALQDAVTKARLAREAFTDALYAAKPAVGLARGHGLLAGAASVASVLPSRTGALLFVLEPSRVWRYTVTAANGRVNVDAIELPIAVSALAAGAQQFTRQIASRDLAFSAASKQLRAQLFQGLDGWLAGLDHLIVVPDGALWQVPFQALQDENGRYLIEQLSVSYTPSLSALAALTARKTSRPRVPTRVVALGDPQTGVSTQRLPEALREVQAVGNLYGASRSVVLTGAAATESAIRQHARQASVLHVATHGDLDNSAPMYSFLRLTPTAASDTTKDGRFEAVEWLDLEMSADLVVLSACTTAGTTSLSGEGLIGQTWALFAGGASSAVVSQWAVDSASTTELMIAFHERYRQTGASSAGPAVAMRTAAQKVMANPRYRHPFYWAGFAVVGVR